MAKLFVLLLAAVLSLPSTTVEADDAQGETAEESAIDISKLFLFTLKNVHSFSQDAGSGVADLLLFQTTIPFKLASRKQLMRISLPYLANSVQGTGLSQATIFDLVMVETKWGGWGVGPAVDFRPLGAADSFRLGFAAGFVYSTQPKLRFGVLTQNLFNDQVAYTTVQPILVYSLDKRWTAGLGTVPTVIDWNEPGVRLLSLGVQLGVLTQPWNQPTRFFLEPQYYSSSSADFRRWALLLGVTLILSPAS